MTHTNFKYLIIYESCFTHCIILKIIFILAFFLGCYVFSLLRFLTCVVCIYSHVIHRKTSRLSTVLHSDLLRDLRISLKFKYYLCPGLFCLYIIISDIISKHITVVAMSKILIIVFPLDIWRCLKHSNFLCHLFSDPGETTSYFPLAHIKF